MFKKGELCILISEDYQVTLYRMLKDFSADEVRSTYTYKSISGQIEAEFGHVSNIEDHMFLSEFFEAAEGHNFAEVVEYKYAGFSPIPVSDFIG